MREHRFEEKFCRGQIFDVLALQKVVQDRETVVFGFLVLLLCDKNFEVQKVYRTREVRMQVSLLVRVLFKDVQEPERFVVFFGFVGYADKAKDVLNLVIDGIERKAQLSCRFGKTCWLGNGGSDFFAEQKLFERACDAVRIIRSL